MGDFKVHHVRFFSPKVLGIQCFSYNELNKKLALSRTDGSIEILGNWYKEKVIPGDIDHPIETIIWVSNRLFSAGGSGEVVEYDLVKLEPKMKAHCNAGPIWCSVKNNSNTRIAVGTDGGCVVLFDVEGGCLSYLKTFSKQEGRILCLDWHINEEIIVTGGIDNIRVWDTNSCIAVERFTMKRYKQKQTFVWCIKILANWTVVSGDSHGRITFWDGKYGTELMSFFSHRADILCLAVSKDEKTVVCSGVDPKLTWFELLSEEIDGIPTKKFKGTFGAASTNEQSKWVRSFAKSFQSHDINSLVFIKDELLSGGADSFITLISPKKKCFKFTGIPHKKMVYIAEDANVLLLQYTTYLELWELGEASGNTGDQEILTLNKQPINQVQLKSKGDKPIVCSALTSNAKIVAYSTITESRVYYLNLVTDSSRFSSRPSVKHMKNFSTMLLPAHKMVFTHDCSKFILATHNGTLQILNFEDNEITCINPAKGMADSIHLLEVSSNSRYVATANNSREVNVFDTISGQHVSTVPLQKAMPTAMTFHPSLPMIFIVYSNMQFQEYSLTENNFTQWSKQIKKKWHSQWLSRRRKITNVSYNPLDPRQLILQDEEMICLLVKDQPFPDPKVHYKIFGHQGPHTDPHAFHIVNKFKYILGSSFLSNGQMVIVEKTPKDFQDDLLPVLRVKKFGMG